MSRFSPQRWQELAPHLDRALDSAGEERAAGLAALRAEDPTLAQDLETLLERQGSIREQGFLDGGPFPGAARPTLAGEKLGAYTLVSPLGQGGMGTVWRAERNDGHFRGVAAVKLLNASLMGRDGKARFRREGSILARLRHPHIAQLIDAGVSTSGQPYLVLEHVGGRRLDRYCDERKLDVDARLRLFLDVLAAVAHAHANLVVHRDLKPSNVLVDAQGQVKLLDFGIAKLLEADGEWTVLTRDGQHALTPQFAAPEQLTGGDVTTATDVYGLGVLLYLLLTGRHPAGADTASPAELVRAVVETEPLRASEAVTVERTGGPRSADSAAERATTPRRLRGALRGDLDNIVGKALKKAPSERYASAEALADDLRRHLAHLPVRARADSVGYRARKFAARNRVALGAAAVAALALATGASVAVWQARTAARQRDRAIAQLHQAEATNDLTSFLLSEAKPAGGRPITNAELLARGEALVDRRFESEPALQAHMLMTLSERYHENEQYDRWQATIDRAYTVSRGIADVGLRSRAECLKAAALDDQGHEAEADRLLAAALGDLAPTADTASDEAYCRVCEANMANRRADSTRAVAAAERAVALEAQRSGPVGRGFEAEFVLANSYLVAGRAGAADAVFQRLIDLLEKQGLGDTRNAALVLNNWSTMLQNAGQSLRAVALSERAVRIARARDGDEGASQVMLRGYAAALCGVGRCDEAVPLIDEAVEKTAAGGSARRHFMALGAAATIHGQAGDLAGAERRLAEAGRILERDRAEIPGQQPALERRQAQLALLRGDHESAVAIATRASGREGDLRDDVIVARWVWLVLAEAQNAHRDFDAARRAAEKALALSPPPEGLPHSAWTGQAHLEHAVALAGLGRRDESRVELRQALDHLQPTLGDRAAPTRRALARLGES